MKEPWNVAELQSSCINIFQVLTCTRHYTDYYPSAKVNGGRAWEGGITALKALSELKCTASNHHQGISAKDVFFWTLGKVKVLWTTSTLQNLIGYWRRV